VISGSERGVSVGVVTWNSRPHVRECLAAVEGDRAAGSPIEDVVVVDNASTDRTPEILAREHPSVRVVRNERNLGFAAAANRAVRETRGAHLLLLNPDCRIGAGYVGTLLEALKAAKGRYGAAGGKLLRPRRESSPGNDTIDSAGLELTLALRVRDRGQGEPDRGRYDADEEVFGLCAAAALFSREFLDDVTLRTGEVFDETFGSYKEDADLAWRGRRLGWRSLYVAGAVAEHRRGFAAERRSDVPAWIRRQSFRNRYLLLLKNATLGDVVSRLPFLLASEFGLLSYAVARDRSLLPAYADALGLAPSALAKRRGREARGARAPADSSPRAARAAAPRDPNAAGGAVAVRGGKTD